MKRSKTVSIIFGVLLTVLLASCSQVFEAGISGKVVTKSGTNDVGVNNVNVFTYTDKDLRDSDFEKFRDGTITRPSQGSGYVATTTTNQNGEFTVNKVVWETKNSRFGKTADVSRLYLIFYHADYDPEISEATIISGSTNNSNVYVELKTNKKEATINLSILDAVGGNAMTSSCTVEYWVGDSDKSDTLVVTGTSSIAITFPISEISTVVKFKLTSPGTNWKMTDSSGKAIAEGFTNVTIQEGATAVKLYMKNYEFTLPAFSGDIDGTLDMKSYRESDDEQFKDENGDVQTGKFNYDSVSVWVEYQDFTDTPEWHKFMETFDAGHRTNSREISAGNSIFYYHGEFSDVGRNDSYTITVDADNYENAFDWSGYDDTKITVPMRLAFKYDYHYEVIENGNTVKKVFPLVKYHFFTYKPGMVTSFGHVEPVYSDNVAVD